MCNMKALSLLVEKLYTRLSLLWTDGQTDRQTDRRGDSYIPPAMPCVQYSRYIVIVTGITIGEMFWTPLTVNIVTEIM